MQFGLTESGDCILDLTQQIKRDMAVLDEKPRVVDDPAFYQERIERHRTNIKELTSASPPSHL